MSHINNIITNHIYAFIYIENLILLNPFKINKVLALHNNKKNVTCLKILVYNKYCSLYFYYIQFTLTASAPRVTFEKVCNIKMYL